jgi:hypothetical protein
MTGKCTRCKKLRIDCIFHPLPLFPYRPSREAYRRGYRSAEPSANLCVPLRTSSARQPVAWIQPPMQSPVRSDNAQIRDQWQPPGFLTYSWPVQEHVAPRDTLVDGSLTGYSTYRGPSATMMTPGYRSATADDGQPASTGTTFDLQAQTGSSSTPSISTSWVSWLFCRQHAYNDYANRS